MATEPESGYQRLPSWVLGFHGCDKSVGLQVLSDSKKHLKRSENEYDWLGSGIYFWENDPQRAMDFAREGVSGKVTRGKIKEPFVIGAVIDLGLCLNLSDQIALLELKEAHEVMVEFYEGTNFEWPKNKGGAGQLLRPLDKAVIEFAMRIREEVAIRDPYDTVRSAFSEGDPLYPGTTICEKNHVQIAVRNTACIKGYFLPRGVTF